MSAIDAHATYNLRHVDVALSAERLAQRRFRHQTRKQPFARLLNLVPVAWIGLAWLLTSPAAIQALPGLAAGAADLFATSGDDTPGGSDSSAPHRFFTKARHN